MVRDVGRCGVVWRGMVWCCCSVVMSTCLSGGLMMPRVPTSGCRRGGAPLGKPVHLGCHQNERNKGCSGYCGISRVMRGRKKLPPLLQHLLQIKPVTYRVTRREAQAFSSHHAISKHPAVIEWSNSGSVLLHIVSYYH